MPIPTSGEIPAVASVPPGPAVLPRARVLYVSRALPGGAGIVADERAPYLPQSRPADECPSNPPRPKLHWIDLRLLGGLRRLRRAQAVLPLAEGRELARLRKVHDRLGGSFGDVIRERLWLQTRTATERITLASLCSRAPACGEAVLSGELSISKVIALKPAIEHSIKTGVSLSPWLTDAPKLTVREIRKRVREAQDSGAFSTGDPRTTSSVPATQPWDPDEEGRFITIEAPPIFLQAWEHAIEITRRVLGRQAPQHVCLEAILSEAAGECGTEAIAAQVGAGSAAGAESSRQLSAEGPAPESGRQLSAHDPVPGSNRQLSARPLDRAATLARRAEPPVMSLQIAEQDLADLEDYLGDLKGIIEDGAIGSDEPRDPEDLLLRLREIHALGRPLEVLEARLVRDLRDTWALDRLGFESFEDFAHRELGLSERTARDLRYLARLCEERPELGSAYGENRIGVTSAFLIDKVACKRTIPQYLRRARKVMPCQLARELKLRNKLDQIDPTLAALWTPQPSRSLLESALLDRLERLGRSRKDIDAFLDPRGLLALRTREPEGKVSDDPAETPWRMRRLEALVELLTLTLCEEGAGLRQMSARPGSPRTPRTNRITFWAPHEVADHLERALHFVQEACVLPDESGRKPILPLWGRLLLLIESALETWERQDPEAIPVNLKLLERDNWGCITPGCTCRQNMEGHHIHLRSRQGSDAFWNRGILCKGDHRRIHNGYIKVKGRAPDGLIWLLGKRLLLRGSRIIRSGPEAAAAFDAL